MLRLIFAVLVLFAATPAVASGLCRHVQTPPRAFQQTPNVDYVVNKLGTPCGGRALACTEQYAPGKWVIEIPNNLDAAETACFIRHEKAHLPPNNWGPGHGRACERCAVFQPGKKLISTYGQRYRRR